MLQRLSKLVTASGMAAALAVGSIPKPAAADSQSTINTILGAAAIVGGIILYNNYQHKRQAANTIVGYTRNGGTVYGDGRIVMPNGQTIYPNSNGQYSWGQGTYYNQNANGYTYDTQRTGQYDTTHRHGRNHSYAPAYNRPVQAYRPTQYRPVQYNRPVYNHVVQNNTVVHRQVFVEQHRPAQRAMPAAHPQGHVDRGHQDRHDDGHPHGH